MITCEPTHDLQRVRDTILAPNNLPWAFRSPLEYFTWRPQLKPGILYLACYQDGVYQGLIATVEQSETRCEGHIAFLPIAFGHTVTLGQTCLDWIWEHTRFREIVAPVVEGNLLARRFLMKLGFEHFQTIPKGWIKDGRCHDLELFKIDKSII